MLSSETFRGEGRPACIHIVRREVHVHMGMVPIAHASAPCTPCSPQVDPAAWSHPAQSLPPALGAPAVRKENGCECRQGGSAERRVHLCEIVSPGIVLESGDGDMQGVLLGQRHSLTRHSLMRVKQTHPQHIAHLVHDPAREVQEVALLKHLVEHRLAYLCLVKVTCINQKSFRHNGTQADRCILTAGMAR